MYIAISLCLLSALLHIQIFFTARSWDIYPLQRHKFPERYSLISSSSGSFNSFSIARTFIINPGLQKPHCSPPSLAKNIPNSSASFCRPSSVVTWRPSARIASVEHDRTGFPSSHTVQRPQFAVSQPLFTL